jgi:hypothetical protein
MNCFIVKEIEKSFKIIPKNLEEFNNKLKEEPYLNL